MSQLRRRKKRATCYMCEREYTSKEHVPPKSFFPEAGEIEPDIDYRRNLITVPSCDLHNLDKSDDDQYLLFVIASSFSVSEKAQKAFSEKMARAITRRPSLMAFYKDLVNVVVDGRPTFAYHIDRERFDSTVSKLASALYFYDFKEKWVDNFFVFSPDIISLEIEEQDTNKMMRNLEITIGKFLSRQDFIGDNPEVFRYKIFCRDNHLLVRMLFFQGVVINAYSDSNRINLPN